jgi:chloride channel, nucleotide-sensitive, 1A
VIYLASLYQFSSRSTTATDRFTSRMEVLREPPKASSFVPIGEHQSTTPASFYSGPPVLHYHSDRSKVIVYEDEINKAPALVPLLEHSQSQHHSDGSTQTNGDSSHIETQKVIEDVDIYVTSEKLLIFSNSSSVGVSIPYPTISLHAVQSLLSTSQGPEQTTSQGVYMQLITSSENDEDVDSISVTLAPTATAPPATTAPADVDPVETEDKPEQTPVQALFNALSDCSNLHPDPVQEGDDDDEGVSRLIQSGLAVPLGDGQGGLPPPMPGSGGWITAENMHEFVDEDGNFIDDEEGEHEEESQDPTPLGPGAGTVRSRGEGEDAEDEAKWQRTS